MNKLISLISGLLFGAGLLFSGMADPAKVLGFLTINQHWNPALMFVMASALAVTVPGFAWLRQKKKPLLSGEFVNVASKIDRQLVVGAAIFGAGWGLGGYCPGPAIVNAGLGLGAAMIFVTFMILGALIADAISGDR
jgi:uncharacterized membrane protein YedE/YeeE